MIVGIIADTHDCLPLIDEAVKRLNEGNVELVMHAGDFVAPFVVSHFKPLTANMIGVFGNNDGDRAVLKKRFEEIGVDIRGRYADVTVNERRIGLLHGDDAELLQALIISEGHDVIVHGHIHRPEIRRQGKTLVINPGEVCGYLGEKPTLVFLNTQTLAVEIIQLAYPHMPGH